MDEATGAIVMKPEHMQEEDEYEDAINYDDEEESADGAMGQNISLFGFETITPHTSTAADGAQKSASGSGNSKNHVVTHVRNYDSKQRAYFYVHSKSKATQWDIPTSGIVRCTAKDGQVSEHDGHYSHIQLPLYDCVRVTCRRP